MTSRLVAAIILSGCVQTQPVVAPVAPATCIEPHLQETSLLEEASPISQAVHETCDHLLSIGCREGLSLNRCAELLSPPATSWRDLACLIQAITEEEVRACAAIDCTWPS